jgi:hypothetical protein
VLFANIQWMTVVLLGLGVLTAAAGILTIRWHRLGIYFSIASFASQAIALSVPKFGYQYAPLLALHLYWANGNFGFIGFIGPESKIGAGASNQISLDQPFFAVDALAVGALFILVKYARARDTYRFN